MKTSPALLLLLLLACLSTALPASAGTFYVAPDGLDSNPGTLALPFATLHQAQEAVRKSNKSEPAVVNLRGGIYYLPETLVFTAADSGTREAPVTYQAYGDEQPVISGGSRLTLTWQPYRDGIMQAAVPPGFTTDQLFLNGERQPMARYPNFDPEARILNGTAKDAISPERAAKWADPKGGFIHAMHPALWGDMHWVITGKDAQGKLTYEGGWQNNRPSSMHNEYRYVENIFEELDAPGEWFLNGKTHTLYFYPPAGTDLSKAVLEAVHLPHLVEFRGSEQAPVRFVTLRGITFRHAARTFMENKEPVLRSDWTTYRGGAVFFNGAEDCALEDAFIDQVGGNAVFVNNYNRRVTVRGAHISKAGSNGIAFFGSPNAVRSPLLRYEKVQELSVIDRTPGPKTNDYPADCLVEDCLIHETGRVEKQTAGVQMDMARSITVRHCSIYDVPRAGINIGDGCWGGHIVEFCDVFDTVKETGDHGSFNSWGRDRYWVPSVSGINARVKQAPELPLLDAVQPNILRNTRWRCDHGWDIDLDDGSSNYLITDNLCLNGGIKNREGYHRTVENNIMVNNTFHPHVWLLQSGDIVRKNIIFGPFKPAGGMPPKPWGEEIDYNFIHQAGVTSPLPAAALQQQTGRDEHSVIADAQFIDPAKGDFRVKDGSPALALGFKNFPMDQFGVRKASLKAIARTPSFEAGHQEGPKRDSKVREWLGAKVKNIVGQGEMSAYGTPGETGVLVLDVSAGSAPAAGGLRKDDVITSLNGQRIDKLADLVAETQKIQPNQVLKASILRTQKEQTLSIHIGSIAPSGGVHALAQDPDGTARLTAESAQIAGHGIRLGGGREKDLGNWKNAADYVFWQLEVTKPGDFQVELTFACQPSSAGSEFSVSAGDRSLSGKVEATGSWDDYRTARLGTLNLAKAGIVTIAVKPLKKPGEAVMNLRTIVLSPVH